MNKTVNINLGGMFFHIDEDAYQKMNRYFDAIKRSLSNSTGKDEIMKDIEMRIAELLLERNETDKHVVGMRDVEHVISIMGQPEDYRIEDEEPTANQAYSSFDGPKKRRKLYRDTEKGMIGGVATGLGHYTGIDAVWIKILLIIIAIISFGTGILVYLILWIVTPAALTTSEKLEMTGEPVNISNIERKVREEFDMVSEKFKNADYDKMGRQFQTGAERVASNVLDVFGKIFKVIAKIIGAIIAVFAACMLTGSVIALVTLGSTTMFGYPLEAYGDAFNYSDMPIWALALLVFFAVAIPLFFLFILGLKLLVENLRSIGNFAKYALLGIWLVSIGILIAFGVKQASEVALDGKTVKKEMINAAAGDTLHVKFRYNDYYAKDLYNRNEMRFVQDEQGKNLIFSNEVHLEFLPTDEKQPYIQIEREARGKSVGEAKKRAEKIVYTYNLEGNHVTLDNYFLTDSEMKFRKQEVSIYIFVPKGMFIKPDKSLENWDWSDDSFFNLHFSGQYSYRVDSDKVRCLDCPADENDHEDLDTLSVGSVKISGVIVDEDGDSIVIKGQSHNTDKPQRLKELKINENGVIIKSE
ncbi:PspC domain-containing protein [Flavobacterium silvaticum]|uniref:PspC domain-containing protein n=1 Tax=Flavobacterium silvaticum TaxID=1852020 RepID=A0A972FNJ8_9FLAO|nr:PspC domain-containing protein [Flavobacterium silvaticum]NMH29334.1 PspC domain-containing protein [Flavobacterium silvaticum]